MRVLLTGSQGFIGTHLQSALTKEKFDVKGFDLVFNEDVRDREAVAHVFESFRPEVVIHLAAKLGVAELFDNLRGAVSANIVGTLNVLECAYAYDCSFVYASEPSNGLNPYSITKIAAEEFVQMYHQQFGVSTVVLKLFNVYGPGEKSDHVRKEVPYFIANALLGKPIEVYGDGEQAYDWVYVSDAVNAFTSALYALLENKPVAGQIFEVGTGVGVSVNRVAEAVVNLTGSKSRIVYKDVRQGETPNPIAVSHSESTNEMLGWRATVPILDKGLEYTISWHRQQQAAK